MSMVSLDTLPDDARLWCFGASRRPDAAQTAHLLDSMQSFIDSWTAHRRDLHAGFDWTHQRFLLIAVDESRAGASGCSLDALMGHLRTLGSELDLDLIDSMPVWYRDASGPLRMCSRVEFGELGRRGEVTGRTRVFDLTLTRLGDVRAGKLEVVAGESWHGSLLTGD
ncbi:MAG: hypothetical protein V3T20_00800 [Gemmatimonadota bacterium]